MVRAATASPAGLVEAGWVESQVADELVAGQDRGVVLFEDHGDGAASPSGTDVDAVAVHVDVAAGVDDNGVGLGSRCEMRQRVARARGWACLPT